MERLLNFYPPLDVNEPRAFIAGIVAVFSNYPVELHELAVAPTGIPARLKYLRSLAEIEQVCEELYAPIGRRIERERIARQPRLLTRRRTPEEQAKIDAQVEKVRKQFGLS